MMARWGVTLVVGGLLAGGSGGVDSVANLKDTARPLLVFTPSETDARFLNQVQALRADQPGLRERQVQVLVYPENHPGTAWRKGLDAALWREPGDGAEVRQSYRVSPGEFAVILVGKDGGEKLRFHGTVTWDRLRGTIDAMPMRQCEMKGH
jgi:hypothetical protein